MFRRGQDDLASLFITYCLIVVNASQGSDSRYSLFIKTSRSSLPLK